MTLEERNAILNSTLFHSKVRVALCDWLNYWAMIGTDSIEDEKVRNDTDNFLRLLIEKLDECTTKVVVLAISDTNIIQSEGEPTDEQVRAAVTAITTHCLPYLL